MGRRREPCSARSRTAGVAVTALLATIAVLLLIGFAALPGSGPPPAAAATSRPLPRFGAPKVVERDDVGDPFVLTVPAGTDGHPAASYVLFWTTDWQSNVPTAVSSDLVHWHRIADALPDLPSWATPSRTMTWGPSALRVATGWVLYFSTEDAVTHLECIGRAFSPTQPTGPYVDSSARPLICQPALGGSIDPSVTADGSGGPVLVWKSDGNARGLAPSIWEQRLSPDGLNLAGSRSRLLGPTASWEHGIVEGPALLADRRGGWWLFFSGGAWQSDTYDTGVAWCRTPAGPCRTASPRPVIASLPTAVSPGGLETFVDGRDRLWASYSAFPGTPADPQAAMAEDRVLEIAPVLEH